MTDPTVASPLTGLDALPDDTADAVALLHDFVRGKDKNSDLTALHVAVAHKRQDVVMALLAAGRDSNATDSAGRTAVFVAAELGNAEILQLLIDAGGSVNAPSNVGRTPLMAVVTAVDDDALQRLRVLLACPTLDLEAIYLDKTAQQWAVHAGNLRFAEALSAEVRQRQACL